MINCIMQIVFIDYDLIGFFGNPLYYHINEDSYKPTKSSQNFIYHL